MSLQRCLESEFGQVLSSKMSDRAKGMKNIIDLLNGDDLNRNSAEQKITWNRFLDTTKTCLKKECERIAQKQGVYDRYSSRSVFPKDKNFEAAIEIFDLLIKRAFQQGYDTINMSNLVGYIEGCLLEDSMKICRDTFLLVLKEHILPNCTCLGYLNPEDLISIFDILKSELEKGISFNCKDLIVFDCLTLLIRNGPYCGLSSNYLRDQFQFISKIGQVIKHIDHRVLRNDVMKIILNFCKHTVEDNRLSCMKLGDEVFYCLLDLYNAPGCDNILKLKFIEFCLLQVTIRSFNGPPEGNSLELAFNWNKCIQIIYNTLTTEISHYLEHLSKNTLFFIPKQNYTVILDTFVLLFVEVSKQLFSDSKSNGESSSSDVEQPYKKRKIETGLESVIGEMQRTKSWIWVTLIGALLKKYPQLISGQLFTQLLKKLQTLQCEKKDSDITKHIYECQGILVDIQKDLDITEEKEEIENMWKLIGKSTLSAVGLNQDIEEIQTLLQKLIVHDLIDLEPVVQMYKPGILMITRYHLNTINIIFQRINFGELMNSQRKIIFSSLLNFENVKDHKCFLESDFAFILVSLVLKQYPNIIGSLEESVTEKYADLKALYARNAFNVADIIHRDHVDIHHESTIIEYNVDDEMLECLFQQARQVYIDAQDESIVKKLCIFGLFYNLLHNLVEYKIISENDLRKCQLAATMKDIIQNEDLINSLNRYESRSGMSLKELLEIASILDNIWSLKNKVTDFAKELVPISFLQNLLKIVQYFHNIKKSGYEHEAKIALINALSKYCVISSSNELNDIQNKIVALLSDSEDYDFTNDVDYTMVLSFLKCLQYANPGALQEDVIDNILTSLESVYSVHCFSYESTMDILSVLKDLLVHFDKFINDVQKRNAVNILNKFYLRLNHYNPEVTVALLSCVEVLCKTDLECHYSKWNNKDIMKFIPDLLANEHQKVRYKAIDVLVGFIRACSGTTRLETFHRVEELVSIIYDKNMMVFEVDVFSKERRLDELECRVVTSVYIFVSMIINCNDFIGEALFDIVKLEHNKKLFQNSNTNLLSKVLSAFESHFQMKDFLKIHLENILNRWIEARFNIDEFPFILLNCSDKIKFYRMYFDSCLPLLFMIDKDGLLSVAKEFKMSERDVLEKSCTNMFARELAHNITNIESQFLGRNKTMIYVTNILGINRLKEVLVENIEDIILYLLSVISDNVLFNATFEETVIFVNKGITFQGFSRCLEYIQDLLYGEQSVIDILKTDTMHKVQKLVLKLQLRVDSAISDNKLKCFHQYTIFIDLITNSIKPSDKITMYYLRDTIYYLVNLTKNTTEVKLQKITIKYLNIFLKNNIPNRVSQFEDFAVFTINALKNLSTLHKNVSSHCIDTLNFLIVENSTSLINIIKNLDTFPTNTQFEQINYVHHKIIKDSGIEITLEDEIKSFLEYRDIESRQDSLSNLKKLLAIKKDQLKKMYDDLSTIKSSDCCQNGLLQRLICTLVKISGFPNKSISMEAIRCLGELGPANLTSFVLQTNEKVLDVKAKPFDLLTGHVLSLLTQYIVDPDVKIMEAASTALYSVLKYKEPRKIANSPIDFGYGSIKQHFIVPYLVNINNETEIKPKSDCNWISNVQIWLPPHHADSDIWVKTLVSELLSSFTGRNYLEDLVPVCELKSKFCETILPLLVYYLLNLNNNAIVGGLSKQINNFFDKHWYITVTRPTNEINIANNKRAVKCMLDVINFVREHSNAASLKSFSFEDLKLNYLTISKAASFCSAHFTALLYGELWCREQVSRFETSMSATSDVVDSGNTLLDYVYEHVDGQDGNTLHNILQNAYKEIGDLDSLSGCGSVFLLQPEYRVEYYKKLGQWDRVMEHYGAEQIQYSEMNCANLIESFKMNQFYQPALLCSQSVVDSQYECLWRLGRWTVNENNAFRIEKPNPNCHEKFKFDSLRALVEEDTSTFIKSKEEFSLCIIEALKHTSLESSKNLYPLLMQLQSLVEMEDFMDTLTNRDFDGIFNKWKKQDVIIRNNDFQIVEPIMAQRITVLGEYVEKLPQLRGKYFDMMLNFADYAKDKNNIRVAQNIIRHIRKQPDLDCGIVNELQLREAQIDWFNNEKKSAQQLLRILCKDNIAPRLKSNALKLQAEYMSESYSDRNTVLKSFYQSSKLLDDLGSDRNNEDMRNFEDTFDKIATFADKEYQQIINHMKSDLFQRKVSNVKKYNESSRNPTKKKQTIDEMKASTLQKNRIIIEETEINTIKTDKETVLCLAIDNYLKNLSLCDTNNIKIFRVMSLLLDNRDNDILTARFNPHLSQMPTYKYVMMLPQLIPHISLDHPDGFSRIINDLIQRCAKDHPHHTLPLLLSLMYANEDQKYTRSKTDSFSQDRVKTATTMINKLQKDQTLKSIIVRMKDISEALVQLAYYEGSQCDQDKIYAIPGNLKICRIRDFSDVLVPTCTLAVSKSNSYDNIKGITKFKPTYSLVGGINSPKRVECVCTTGETVTQLVKGQDDLRQDAVMQQVFNIITDLLASNQQTRNMLIRTYKIVPLSMRSGILEWVANSTPIGDYLVGTRADNHSGAHVRFRPKDMRPRECRVAFQNCAKRSPEEKLAVFNRICDRFKPVFHKFFETQFAQPSVWYEKRKAYTRSVATTSMCGYILGIGDRHVSNIVIDQQSAELVHIDFGIAFEQGKCLPTPETIPFRLSRDIVDGMGVSGVEGLFRKSCEKTMEVLRANAQTILTILEVLLYDPLYFWAVTQSEVNRRQNEGDSTRRNSDEMDDEKNISAETALIRLRGKLQGTEEGKPTSVENQVGTLIQRAMDPANLCKLFHGWQPYI